MSEPDTDVEEDPFDSPEYCWLAGHDCPCCGTRVATCQCGDWGCNWSSHLALTCEAERDDDMLDEPGRLCECGHRARDHRNNRSCIIGVTVVGCACEWYAPS